VEQAFCATRNVNPKIQITAPLLYKDLLMGESASSGTETVNELKLIVRFHDI
jgi:hypothetical protein